jgi:hypothetical protein
MVRRFTVISLIPFALAATACGRRETGAAAAPRHDAAVEAYEQASEAEPALPPATIEELAPAAAVDGSTGSLRSADDSLRPADDPLTEDFEGSGGEPHPLPPPAATLPSPPREQPESPAVTPSTGGTQPAAAPPAAPPSEPPPELPAPAPAADEVPPPGEDGAEPGELEVEVEVEEPSPADPEDAPPEVASPVGDRRVSRVAR